MRESNQIPFPGTGIGKPTATGRQAFAVLAREHHRGLLVYARALSRNEATSADLVQDAFVTAWKNLDRFDTTRDFGAWLRGIVRNKWREHLRRHAREVDVGFRRSRPCGSGISTPSAAPITM